MFKLIFIVIGFACLGITTSMQLEQLNFKLPTMLRCNKCLAFWMCLGYCLATGESLLAAPIAAILSIIIYNRL